MTQSALTQHPDANYGRSAYATQTIGGHVLVDVDDTLTAFLAAIRPLTMLVKGQNRYQRRQNPYINSKIRVEKFNTQVLSLSSKSLKALLDAALKMASEVDQRLSTSIWHAETGGHFSS